MSRRSGTLQLTTPLQSGEIIFRLGKVVAVYHGEARHSVGESLIDTGLLDVMQYQEMLARQKDGVTGAALFAAFGLVGEGLDAALEELLKRAVYGMFEWKEGTFSFVLEDQPDPWRGFAIDSARIVVERGLNPQYLAIEGARLRDEHSKEDPVEDFIAKTTEPVSAAVTQANSESLARSLRTERADEDFSQLHLEPATSILPETQAAPRGDAEKVIPFPTGRGRRDGGKLALARAAEAEPESVAEPQQAPATRPADPMTEPVLEPQVAGPTLTPAAAELERAAVSAAQALVGPTLTPATAELERAAVPAAEASSVAPTWDESERPQPMDAPLSASGWRLLVVDDDAQVTHHLATTFAPRFVEVLTASSVQEALTHLQKHPAGLVVATDLIISRSDDGGILGGIEILEKVRKYWPQTPVFLFTDYTNEEARGRASQLGVSGQLMKPRKAQIYGDGRRGVTPPMRDFIGRMDTLLAPYISGELPVPAPAPEHIDIRQELGVTLPEQEVTEVNVVAPGGVDMANLRSMIAELRDPSSRDAVTLLVLRFASSMFERGALFLATRRHFVGLGGFSQTEASDQFVVRVRQLQVPVELESLFSKVARFRSLVRGPLEDTAGNRRLISGLGGTWHNHETVAAPLISGDRVAAILFGDNPSNKPLGSMDGLEIFMQQAGLVMERALLERKLEESRHKDPAKKL